MDNFGNLAGAGVGFAVMAFSCILSLVIYLFFAWCLYLICKKCQVENAWLAWIPIVQIVPMVQAGGKPLWWILIIIFVPLVNIVFSVLLWMAISERRGKPSWVGILTIVPIVNLFVLPYLAFAK